MKTVPNFKALIKTVCISACLVLGSTELMAQDKNSQQPNDFRIIIEKSGNQIKMESDKGAAWVKLSLSPDNTTPQTIDEYGITDVNNVNSKKDPKLADFLFTITKTKNGVKLKGIEGTDWKDLEFSLIADQKQMINRSGVLQLK
ncbi:hypothetical protein [Bizionia paragorgiae]|uniref:Uncharacterized protein n=1 Tax=Bizionia paragorgiae TaxID=283786 RepID=A0A1H3XUJ8_BIZPA|nr:hypothetical protein [Bizionia paragorgiae]SEA03157.1 hypothetical protein SAMN04487990_105184 [Bizionia paragorgiae]